MLTKLFMLVAGAFVMSVYAQQQTTQRVGTVVDPQGDAYEKLSIVPPPFARMIIYRLPDNRSQNAAGIEINGHYHTSLQAGSYSELCMPAPTAALISSRMAELAQTVKNDVDATTTLNLKHSQETYLRVTEISDGRAVLEVVANDIAKKELPQTLRQLHAASRVPNAGSCAPEAATAKQGYKQVETITIAVDALFEFGKSDAQGILPSARGELKTVIDRMQAHYAKYDNVHFEIVGYTDPLGNAISNQRLSEERAKTIHEYFVAAGINSNKLSSKGRAAESLVEARCDHKTTALSIACNSPNRRVVVNVSTLTQ